MLKHKRYSRGLEHFSLFGEMLDNMLAKEASTTCASHCQALTRQSWQLCLLSGLTRGAVQVPSPSQLLVPTPHCSASLQVHVPECFPGRHLSSSFLVEKLYRAQRDYSFFFSISPLSLSLGEERQERGERCSRGLFKKV